MADPELLWQDPSHWTMWGYNCKEDPRVIVPKRNRSMGWTMNWAHASAVPMLFVMMLVAATPTVLVVGLGMMNVLDPFTSVALSVLAVPVTVFGIVAFCKRFSRTT